MFGMGTGVTSLPLSLDWVFVFEDKIHYNNSGEYYKCFSKKKHNLIPSKLDKRVIERHSFFWLSPRSISIRQLHMSPRFHLEPIYLIVFEGSYLLA